MEHIVSKDNTLCMYDYAKDILFDNEITLCMNLSLEELRTYVAEKYPEYQVFPIHKLDRYKLISLVASSYS